MLNTILQDIDTTAVEYFVSPQKAMALARHGFLRKKKDSQIDLRCYRLITSSDHLSKVGRVSTKQSLQILPEVISKPKTSLFYA